MNILFVHQNFPGQYRELFQWLVAQGGHEIVFLTQRKGVPPVNGARIVEYTTHHKPAETAYAPTKYWEECTGNGLGAAFAAQKLAAAGFSPDRRCCVTDAQGESAPFPVRVKRCGRSRRCRGH